jgi:hypothetical protein
MRSLSPNLSVGVGVLRLRFVPSPGAIAMLVAGLLGLAIL